MKVRDIILRTVANTEAVILNKAKKSSNWISNRSFLSLEIMFPLQFEKLKKINTVWARMLEFVDFELVFN